MFFKIWTLCFLFSYKLSTPSEVAANGVDIYHKLLYHLCGEHIDYALNLTLQGMLIKGF